LALKRKPHIIPTRKFKLKGVKINRKKPKVKLENNGKKGKSFEKLSQRVLDAQLVGLTFSPKVNWALAQTQGIGLTLICPG